MNKFYVSTKIYSGPNSLDVLGRSLGLAVYDHHSETIHVDTDRQHVRRENGIDRPGLPWLPVGHPSA